MILKFKLKKKKLLPFKLNGKRVFFFFCHHITKYCLKFKMHLNSIVSLLSHQNLFSFLHWYIESDTIHMWQNLKLDISSFLSLHSQFNIETSICNIYPAYRLALLKPQHKAFHAHKTFHLYKAFFQLGQL